MMEIEKCGMIYEVLKKRDIYIKIYYEFIDF